MRFSTATLLLFITPTFTSPTANYSPDPQSAIAIPADRRGNDRHERYNRCVARAPDGPRRFPNSCYYDNDVRRDCAEKNDIDRITVQDCRTGRFYTQYRGRNGRYSRDDNHGRDYRDGSGDRLDDYNVLVDDHNSECPAQSGHLHNVVGGQAQQVYHI